jgi:glucose-1-phosphatase
VEQRLDEVCLRKWPPQSSGQLPQRVVGAHRLSPSHSYAGGGAQRAEGALGRAPMLTPELVIFDMDDVLCHYSLGRRLRALATMADVTARDVRAAVWDSGFEDLADTGGYAEIEYYLNEFGTRLGKRISLEQWIEARRLAMTPNLEVLSVAKKIGQETSLAIYTNNGPVVKNHLEQLFPEAAEIFKLRFCSYEFGTKKPDPISFTKLMEKLDQRPERSWFIDDKKSNVEGAKIAGLHAHLYVNCDALITEAKQMGFTL